MIFRFEPIKYQSKYFLFNLLFVSFNLMFNAAVSQIPNPVHQASLMGSGALLYNPNAVSISGSLAFVTSVNNNALSIVDISSPGEPTLKGTVVLQSPISVFATGTFAYVATYRGMAIVDVSDPSSPAIKGAIEDGSGGAVFHNPTSVFVAGYYAYVVSAIGALEIVDISDPINPT